LFAEPWSLTLPSLLSIEGADDFMKSTILSQFPPSTAWLLVLTDLASARAA
jgi:hypothetical protein